MASELWRRFGDVANYVEPFAGSLAALLLRPLPAGAVRPRGTETVNDLDAYLSNFWRAVSADPDAVAHYADWPVSELDLHARHRYLVLSSEAVAFRERMRSDPDFYDARMAGWWVWGASCWIGGGWCKAPASERLPHLSDRGQGDLRLALQLPHLGDRGRGVAAPERQANLVAYLRTLQERLCRVRVACGDWSRVLGPSVTEKLGTTAILLDPPYDNEGRAETYTHDDGSVGTDVRRWCAENGNNPALRIALCGYSGEHDALEALGWGRFEWRARGGYGSQGQGRGRANANREVIWFSPHCLQQSRSLFDEAQVLCP